MLNKYVALHAAQLLQEGQPIPALGVFTQYGTSENPANFNLYRFDTTIHTTDQFSALESLISSGSENKSFLYYTVQPQFQKPKLPGNISGSSEFKSGSQNFRSGK